MIIHLYRQLFLFLWCHLGFFGAIVGISVIVSMICLPLYAIIGKMVAKENELQGELYPLIDELKRKYADDSASYQAALERLYKRYQYNPFLAIRKVLPLFVALPFLFLTYYMLEGTEQLNGVAFLCFRDVGKADGLLWGVNLLPFVMTGINLLTALATPGLTDKDRNQAVFIALFFLVFLYTANAALMIYWCLNQIFNMLRSLYIDNWAGAKCLMENIGRLIGFCNPIRMLRNVEWPELSWWTPLVIVRNYAVLLLCVFLPALFLIFGHMPDRLEVDIQSNAPLSMRAGFLAQNEDGEECIVGEIVQGCPLGKHKDPVRFFFADGCDADSLRIRLSGTDPDYTVSSLSVVRHLVFRYRIPHVIDQHVIRSAAQPVFEGVEIPNVKGSYLAFKGGLAALLLLAVLGLFARKDGVRRCEWKLSPAMALIAAAFFTVVLPCQTIFTNRDVFDYPASEIVMQIGFVFVLAVVALFVILSVASTVYGRWPHVVLLGVLVYEYLQTGVLSINAPRMDGNVNYYWTAQPMLVDFAVMAAVGILCLWKSRWIKVHFRTLFAWCIFGVIVSVAMTAFDAARQSPGETVQKKANDVPWNFQRSQVAKAIRYSPLRNIIVLVLDSTQSDAAYAAAEVDPELRAAFDGFTAFNNHVGMHDNTYSGSVGLFTGEYYLNDVPMGRHFEKCWGEGSFVTPYLQADCPVYLLPGVADAFSNRMENRRQSHAFVASESIFLRRVKSMNTSLLDVLQLRLVPFFLKKWDLQVMYLGSVVSDGTMEEHSLFPELAKCPVGSEDRTALLYIHTEGTHAPIRYDEFGNRLWTDKDHYRGLCGETHYIMKSVAAYLRDLKRLGVYDKSMIVVTADHGCCFATPQLPKLKKLPTRAIPMLWIKPIGTHGNLAQTEAPTSHSKLAEVIRRAKDQDLAMPDVTGILKTDVRRFIIDYDGFVNWYVDADGNRILGGNGK